MRQLGPVALTAGVALVGGLAAQLAGMPAAFLMGGAIAVSIAAVAGLPMQVPDVLRNCVFIVVGMTLGTNVARDSLSLIVQWPFTMIGLALALGAIIVLVSQALQKGLGFDRGTAYLSSFPGHLSFVLGMSESGYGESRHIAVMQSIRVLVLTVLVPLVARFQASGDLTVTAGGPVLSPISLIVLAVACIAGGFVFRLLRAPAAFVLGAMVVATAGKLMGLYEGRLPLWLTLFGFLFMGALIGSRFSNVSFGELRRTATGGLVSTAICVAIVSIIAYGLTYLVDMPFGQLWVGLAPGALESMGALGIALGYDTAFIAAHHTARFFLLTLLIPTVAAVAGRPHPPPRQ